MKITAIKIGVLNTPLITPFKTAVRSVNDMTDVVVRIEADNGLAGWGSAPPTAKVTGDTVGSIIGAIDEQIRPVMLNADADDLEGCLDILGGALLHNTSAKAAVDIALHDLWARSMGQPAWKLFGGCGGEIRTDVTVSVNSPEEMARDARRAVADGFDIIKIKVGVDAAVDLKRIRAIRDAAGNEVKIRIDANQGWKANEAVRLLDRLYNEGLGIELVEQPVKAEDIEGMAFVTARSPIPVVADESCQSPADAIKLLSMRAADMVNIKIMKCGGVRAARQIISVAEAMGAGVMFGSMLEGKVSAAAAAHLSSAYGCVTCVDIDGPALCKSDPVAGGPVFNGPRITFTDTPGFGIENVPGLKWLD